MYFAHIVVEFKDDIYKINWNLIIDPEGTGTVLTNEKKIPKLEIRSYAEAVYVAISDLATELDTEYSEEEQKQKELTAFQNLAKAGNDLFLCVLPEEGSEYINALTSDYCTARVSVKHTGYYIPWGLIWSNQPPKSDPSNYNDILDLYDQFWSVKHSVFATYDTVRQVTRPIQRSFFEGIAHYETYQSETPQSIQNLLNTYKKHSNDMIFHDSVGFNNWLENIDTKESEKMSLVFVTNHGADTGIQIGRNKRDVLDSHKFVKQMDRKKYSQTRSVDNDTLYTNYIRKPAQRIKDKKKEGFYLSLINACNTTHQGEALKASFLDLHIEGRGRSVGFIGTYAEVPEAIALQFKTAFIFYFCYQGKSIEETFLSIRKYMKPVDIFYTAYTLPSLRIKPINDESKVEEIKRIREF